MRDELVKRLWECASGECFNCSQYTETTNASVCSKELMKQAADSIEELSAVVRAQKAVLEKFPRWIPVTERLPELHEEVIVCNEEYGRSKLGFAMFAVWDGTGWIETWNRRAAIHCVSNWMPLPEPPKEEDHA